MLDDWSELEAWPLAEILTMSQAIEQCNDQKNHNQFKLYTI